MKNFKYVSPLDFLSPVQAKMPYDDRILEQKNQDIVLVFHVTKMFRMSSSKRKDKQQQQQDEEEEGGKDSSSTIIPSGAFA